MKRKRILAWFLAAVSCLSLAVSAAAAGTTTRKATDFKDYDRTAWYAEAVSAAVDNGLDVYKRQAIVPGEDSFTVLPPKLETLKLYMPLTCLLYTSRCV